MSLFQKRKSNFNYLFEKLQKYEFFDLPMWEEKADVSWFGFPITINEKASFTRGDLMNKFAENKIGTRFLFGGNILLQPAYEGLDLGNPDDYPNANRVVDRTFWIGVYPGLTVEMLDFVILTIDEFINKES